MLEHPWSLAETTSGRGWAAVGGVVVVGWYFFKTETIHWHDTMIKHTTRTAKSPSKYKGLVVSECFGWRGTKENATCHSYLTNKVPTRWHKNTNSYYLNARRIGALCAPTDSFARNRLCKCKMHCPPTCSKSASMKKDLQSNLVPLPFLPEPNFVWSPFPYKSVFKRKTKDLKNGSYNCEALKDHLGVDSAFLIGLPTPVNLSSPQLREKLKSAS